MWQPLIFVLNNKLRHRKRSRISFKIWKNHNLVFSDRSLNTAKPHAKHATQRALMTGLMRLSANFPARLPFLVEQICDSATCSQKNNRLTSFCQAKSCKTFDIFFGGLTLNSKLSALKAIFSGFTTGNRAVGLELVVAG